MMNTFHLKKTFKVLALSTLALSFSACEKDFEEINTNPTQASNLGYGFEFTYAQLYTAGDVHENWRNHIGYSGTWIQHLASTAWTAEKYFYTDNFSAALWERTYQEELRAITDIINRATAENDPNNANRIAAARTWRAFIVHWLTDIYGDIPYSEAVKGYTDNIPLPKYDTQESIYKDLLKELDEAATQFDASKPTYGNADLIFGGNVAKWKKFTYSMMLRLGMRLTKVDAALAQTYVKKAIAGGVMTSNDDSAILQHTDGPAGVNRNGDGAVLGINDKDAFKISKTLMDRLLSTNDPRATVYCMNTGGSTDKSTFLGLPNGLDATTLQSYGGNKDINAYSRVNTKTMAAVTTARVFQQYAEVQLLLAEAAVRGWHSADPATLYQNAVRAHMKQLNDRFGGSISDADVTAYLTANPYNASKALEVIHTEYWVSHFMQFYEAYSNWRRTGIPALTPVNYPGNNSNGTIPRRHQYPLRETVVNNANLQAAASRMGGDTFTSRMWWDK